MKKFTTLVLSLVLLLTACGGGDASTTKEGTGGKLTVAMSTDATSLDPTNFNTDYSDMAMHQVYNNLITKNEKGELVNSLAEDITEEDPTTYTVKLREGVKFHNGETLTADDVIFSLKRISESEKYGPVFSNFANLEKVDDLTVKITLKSPSGTFMESLAHPGASILNEKATNEGDMTKAPVGTGPFVFKEWVDNDHISFTANDEYWEGRPVVDELEIRIIPEANNRMIELESGGVDIALDLTPEDVTRVSESEDLQLFKTNSFAVTFLAFNTESEPFNNPVARKAIAHGIDVEAIVKNVFKDTGTVATGVINPDVIYSISKDLNPIEYNPEKAKELLAEAGIAEGTTIEMYISDDNQRADIATIMQEQLRQIGLNMNITRLEWGAFVEELSAKKDHMFLLRWNPSIVDPDQYLYPSFSTNTKGSGPNYGFYGNPELDALIDQGRVLSNSPEREAIYKQAQEFVMEDLPWVPLAYGQQNIAGAKYVSGFTIRPNYTQEFNKVTLNK